MSQGTPRRGSSNLLFSCRLYQVTFRRGSSRPRFCKFSKFLLVFSDLKCWLDGVPLKGGGGKQEGPKKDAKSAPKYSKHFQSMKKMDFGKFGENSFFMILGVPVYP